MSSRSATDYRRSKRLTDRPAIDLPRLLSTLERHGVDYVIVGGIAALLQGASRPTADVDLLIDSSADNILRFLGVCKELRIRNRTGNEKLDSSLAKRAAERDWYVSDVQDIFWSAQSDAGPIDVLPTMAMSQGRASYESVVENADEVLITTDPSLRVKVASVEQLIESKQTVGRKKDLVVVEELQQLAAAREARTYSTTGSGLYVTHCRGSCGGQGSVRPLVTGDDTLVLMCEECEAIWFRPEAIYEAPAEYPSPPSWTLSTGQSIEPGTTRWASRSDIADLTDWDSGKFND